VKDEFLANISHELRTPLTAVMGYLALMEEGLAGPVTPEQRKTLAQVKTASQHLLDLIADLLELTTLKRGGIEATTSAFDVRDPLHDAISATRGRPESVALRVSEPETTTLMVSDRRKIVKLLGALLSNAYKFTPQGEIRLSVAVRNDHVVYRVEDTGIGIADEMQQLVFEEFRQADGSSTRRYGGSGLGLALARRLARLLGGEIYLDSAPGAGSTFRVELPLEYRDPEAPPLSAIPR
jgi:signal transduction histidine kinase